MPEVIVLPVVTSTDADERGQADNDRKRRLFDWALDVIKSLGLDKAVTRATSIARIWFSDLKKLSRSEIAASPRKNRT